MKAATLTQLQADRQAKRPVVLATWLEAAGERLVYPAASGGDPLTLAAAEAARLDRSGVVELAEGKVFLHVFNPPLRLIVVGAVHIAQPLSRMAALAGYDVTVIDPRGKFASEDRFPGVSLSSDWPDDGLAALKPDARTAIVTLTHDPKLDDPALAMAVRSSAFYVGALGSRGTHGKRLQRLESEGLTAAELGRIKGPVGLDIGAKSPAEIAVSILAEITLALRGGSKAAKRAA